MSRPALTSRTCRQHVESGVESLQLVTCVVIQLLVGVGGGDAPLETRTQRRRDVILVGLGVVEQILRDDARLPGAVSQTKRLRASTRHALHKL